MQSGTSSPPPIVESRANGELSTRELVAVLLTVVLADLTVYRGHGYAGLAAFFTGALALLYFARSRRQLIRPLWIVGAMLLLLALRLLWFGSPLQVIAGVVLVVAFATALDGQQPYVLTVMTMGAQSLAAGLRSFGEGFSAAHRVGPSLHGRRSLSILLPVVSFVLFSVLFVLANPDAVSFVGRQFEAVLRSMSEWLIRVALRPTEPLFWIAVALFVAGLLKPLLRLPATPLFARSDAGDTPAEAPLFAAFRNMLVTLIGLFAVYLAYEVHTLWTRDFPQGFYYAGYAHEGAAWLTVALALATLILSLVFSGRVLHDARLSTLRLLAWIWSLQNLLFSLSVYNRLFIYIDFNGMTRMRIVGLFGISLTVVGFLLVIWKIAHGKDFPWLIHRQVWALAGAIYLFALTPVDGIAASYNVRRVLGGDLSACMQIGVQPLDLEGILALPPLLDSPVPEIRDGVAALIAERYLHLQLQHQRRQQEGWTAYQLIDEFALERLGAVRPQWQPYEDGAQRQAAIERFHDFAYRWY